MIVFYIIDARALDLGMQLLKETVQGQQRRLLQMHSVGDFAPASLDAMSKMGLVGWIYPLSQL